MNHASFLVHFCTILFRLSWSPSAGYGSQCLTLSRLESHMGNFVGFLLVFQFPSYNWTDSLVYKWKTSQMQKPNCFLYINSWKARTPQNDGINTLEDWACISSVYVGYFTCLFVRPRTSGRFLIIHICLNAWFLVCIGF